VVIFSLSAGRVAPPVFGGIKIRRKNSIEQERRGRGSDSLFICAATAEQRLHNAPQTERHRHAHTRGLIEVKAKAKQKQKQGKIKQTQSGDPTEWVVWSQQSQTEKTEPMANISPMETAGKQQQLQITAANLIVTLVAPRQIQSRNYVKAPQQHIGL